MKRYGNLYHKIIAPDNLRLAHQKAKKGKQHYTAIRRVDRDLDTHINTLHKSLLNKNYQTSIYEIFHKISSGKDRVIFKLPYYPDRIVHHAIMNILEPIWKNIFIRDTYSSIQGRGIHDGVVRLQQFLKDKEGTKYCLKVDVKKFYPSINHEILKHIIRKKIKCKSTLLLLYEIIDSAPGVPIGNYLSQYFGNLYLTYFDHYCKEELNLKYYSRYCDDIVILHHSKKQLHCITQTIVNYLYTNLQLSLNYNYQVFPTNIRGIDYLGYRFFGEYTLIRKNIACRFKHKIYKLNNNSYFMKTSIARSSIMSYKGWFKYADGYNLWNKYFTYSIQQLLYNNTKLTHLPCGR